jgi:hypothetical protein
MFDVKSVLVAKIVNAVLLLVLAGCGQPAARPSVAIDRSNLSRPPDLFGIVENIQEGDGGKSGHFLRFLLRCRQPPPGVEESAQNKYLRRHEGPHIGVRVFGSPRIPVRGGGTETLAVGATVSVWYSGGHLLTLPPQCRADAVIIESKEAP